MSASDWRRAPIALSVDGGGWMLLQLQRRASDHGAEDDVAAPPTCALVADAARALLLCAASTEGASPESSHSDSTRGWNALVLYGAPHALLIPPSGVRSSFAQQQQQHQYDLYWRASVYGDAAAGAVQALAQLPQLSAPALDLTRDWSEQEMVTALSLPRRMTKSYNFMRRFIFKDASRMRQASRAEQEAFRAAYRPQAALASDFESDEWWARRDAAERTPHESPTASLSRPRLSAPDRRRNDARISNARAKLTQQRKARRAASSDSSGDDSDEDSESES